VLDLSVLILLIFLNFTKSFENIVKLIMIIVFIVNIESCNEIDDLVFVLDWMNPPVVDNELQLGDFSIALSDFSVFVERLTHNGNQHVQEMNAEQHCHQKEETIKDWSH